MYDFWTSVKKSGVVLGNILWYIQCVCIRGSRLTWAAKAAQLTQAKGRERKSSTELFYATNQMANLKGIC